MEKRVSYHVQEVGEYEKSGEALGKAVYQPVRAAKAAGVRGGGTGAVERQISLVEEERSFEITG